MEAENRITRLTEREKEALRRWLGHKTAKEIALDLGISHHAVEKRLKMARVKLGGWLVSRSGAGAGGGGEVPASRKPVLRAFNRPAKRAQDGDIRPSRLEVLPCFSRPSLPLPLFQRDSPPLMPETPADTDAIELDANMAPIF